MATTTNFGWETPDDTDLVKDGAAAIRTALGGVDTSFVDLKGGTTGQVLAKASNTDLDFVWSADAAGIPTTIVDAKGDLIAATAADTVSRLAVGTNGQVLMADSAEATGIKWASAGGGLTLLDSGSLTGSSVTTASLSQSYVDLYVIIRDWYPATDLSRLRARVNGVSAANSYVQGINAGSASIDTLNTDYIGLSIDTDNTVHKNIATISVPDYANAVTYKYLYSNSFAVPDTTTSLSTYAGIYGITKAVDAVTTLTFFPSSGNFSGGNYYVYGVK